MIQQAVLQDDIMEQVFEVKGCPAWETMTGSTVSRFNGKHCSGTRTQEIS